MPKVSTRPLKRSENTMLEDPRGKIAEYDPAGSAEYEAAQAEKATEKPEKGADDATKALMDRLDRLERQNEQLHQTNMALMMAERQAGYSQSAPQQVPQQPQLDMTGLPDPLEDPTAYANEIARRTIAYQQQYQQSQWAQYQPVQAQANAEQTLWEHFVEANPEYAKRKDQIDFAARKVASRAQARGVDLQRYCVGAMDQFFEDVKKEHENIFGSGLPSGAKKSGEDGDEDDNSRSTSLPAGSPTSAGLPKGDGLEPSQDDLLAELQEIQRKKAGGFY